LQHTFTTSLVTFRTDRRPGRAHAESAARYHGVQGGSAINTRALRFGAVALACLLASACKGRQEPVKPIAALTLAPIVCFIDY
jgi:hypothetical protein